MTGGPGTTGAPIGVIVVRDSVLPAGALDVVGECGRAVLVGTGAAAAAQALSGVAAELVLVEAGPYAPARYAAVLADVLAGEPIVVLPASPDGRDLAPRLAARLGVPLLAGAIRVTASRVELARGGGLLMQHVDPPPRFVATLIPGVRGAPPATDGPHTVRVVDPGPVDTAPPDARSECVLPADVSTMDLAEAGRVLAGGAGLDGAERFAQLRRIGAALDAAVGATRVVTDRHWVGHERQIGSTGVFVDPDLYVAFGISGAVQHVAGLGRPAHTISVNTDPHCPMMQLADLAIVADANAVIDELVRRLTPPEDRADG